MSNITDRQINAKPGETSRWISESVVRGHGALVVRITPAGERVFYFRYVNSNGKRDSLPIGTYSREETSGCLTLTQARFKAKELAGLHQSGTKDIREHLEEAEQYRKAKIEAELIRLEKENLLHKSRITVGELFDDWMKVELLGRKDKGASALRLFSADVFPKIGQLAAEDVRRSHVMDIVDSILARNAKRMAKVTLSELRQMFRYGIVREHLSTDPTYVISKAKIGGKNVVRDRVLSNDDILLLIEKLPSANLLPTTELAIWICLSTACRIGEILSAKWSDINFDRKTWFLPETKSDRAFTIYLSDFSLSHFEQLKQHTANSIWCYPNRNNTGHVNLKSITKQIMDRQRKSDQGSMKGRSKKNQSLILPGGKWTPHDLRRTASTMMTQCKVQANVASRCQNHVEENTIIRTYQHYAYDKEMKEAWDILGKHLMTLKN
ncbi:site-specific integrase [Nitrincola tibetensis]|uniref:Site-specific integrase n=1 Tax=Nitrincola tibetensis TaxID=2219697 RepID=A0A364NSM4_9GAMM|nr:site-specific integrase [Nitrincola tibetensis]RAU19897.1 site-specific integrase [Nitrincola tibetensis]